MAFMGAMKGMMGPAKSMGGAMGMGGMGAGNSQQNQMRQTGGMGSMVKSAMNPMQQMRGLGPSSAVPQQKFSGMRGPSRQREQMPMNQAANQAQPMIQAPQMEQGPPDLGSQDPSQQQYMPKPYGQSDQATDQGPYRRMFGPGYGTTNQGMHESGPRMGQPDRPVPFSWPKGIGPSMPMNGNRGMGGDRAGYMQDLNMMNDPYRTRFNV